MHQPMTAPQEDTLGGLGWRAIAKENHFTHLLVNPEGVRLVVDCRSRNGNAFEIKADGSHEDACINLSRWHLKKEWQSFELFEVNAWIEVSKRLALEVRAIASAQAKVSAFLNGQEYVGVERTDPNAEPYFYRTSSEGTRAHTLQMNRIEAMCLVIAEDLDNFLLNPFEWVHTVT